MKSLPRILGLTFLSLTLTNCSRQLSSGKIASLLEPSIVKLFYRNQPGHGTGFFVPGEKGLCTVLTSAHVVNREGENLLQTKDRKVWPVAKVNIFPRDIDLALVTFKPVGKKCNYPPLKIGNSDNLKIFTPIYISGFPTRSKDKEHHKVVRQSVVGTVSGLDTLGRGYGVSYEASTWGGMSGAPVVDMKGEVVAVHGMTDVQVMQSFASLQGSFSDEQRSIYQGVVKRVENGVEVQTFRWGVPINEFRESDFYYDDAFELSLWQLWLGFFTTGSLASILHFVIKYYKSHHKPMPKSDSDLDSKHTQLVPKLSQDSDSNYTPRSSYKVNYTKLELLLAMRKWKEADTETALCMLKILGREKEGSLELKHIKNFPSKDIKIIDQLWLKYSNGKFGFSVQKKIYQSLGGTEKYDHKVWAAFGDKVGWRQEGQWLSYEKLILNSNNEGHLPGAGWGNWGRDRAGFILFSHIDL